MAEHYLFFNAMEIEPGVFDREYKEQDFAIYFGSVLSSGLLHTDEVPGMQVSVENGTMNTVVSPGRAIMRGHLYENTEPLTLKHSIPEAKFDRIDRVVLRLDSRQAHRNILLHVKEGAAANVPVAPALQRDAFIYEISLAKVYVHRNTASLHQSDLTDERLIEDVCGLVHSLISIPTSQFQEQWDLFFGNMSDEMKVDQQRFIEAWQEWFDSIQDASYVTGETFYGYKEVVDSRIKVIQDVVIHSTGWSLDSETNLYKYDIENGNIHDDSVVDVNVHLEFMTDAMDLSGASRSYNGFVRLYADSMVFDNIVVDLKIIREAS